MYICLDALKLITISVFFFFLNVLHIYEWPFLISISVPDDFDAHCQQLIGARTFDLSTLTQQQNL